jgi:DNA-directed RNA polymerase specialized sigma24 family protein
LTYTQKSEYTFELLYNAAAKPLYNLALYSIGDQATAERILTDVFVEVFYTISDHTDLDFFKKKCMKLIYRRARKIRIKLGYDIGSTAPFKMKGGQQKSDDIKRAQLFNMLSKLSFEERYIILLFCWQRLSFNQIAETIYRPRFITRKHLYAIANKIVKRRGCNC